MSHSPPPFVSYVQHNFLSNFGLRFHLSDSEKLWVGKPLGMGSEGEVYLGTYDPPQLMALKFIKKTPETMKKLETFLKISLKLNHPNITRLLAYSMDDEFVGQFGRSGDALFVYALHKCKSLRDNLIQKGHLKEDETKKFITDILKGLAYMHGRGISHNDIKPENIMVDCPEMGENEHAIIIDLNGACFFHRNCENPSITSSYAAPESIGRSFVVGSASDIWAVGILTYELLTGKNPLKVKSGGPAGFIDAVKNLYDVSSPDKHPISDSQLLERFGKLKDIAKTDPSATEFIISTLHMNPKERPTANYLLKNSNWLKNE